MAGANSQIQMTDLDFNGIKNNLKTFLQSQDTLKDYNYEGSALSTLLDILAYNTQYNAYYLNMVANEMFLDSAIQRSSVVSQAKLLNYIPQSSLSPSATIRFVVNQVSAASLTLPKFTTFMSEAIDGINYNFVTTDATTVAVSANTAIFPTVSIKQGVPSSLSFTVDSTANPKYKFNIPEENLDTTTIQVLVQQSSANASYQIFTKAENYLTLDSSSLVYFLQESLDGTYDIYFGDNILGKQLTNGNIVIVSYVVAAVADASFASKAVCVAVETGLLASDVLSTFARPTSDFVIPVGVLITGEVSVLFVKVADAARSVALDVLSTLPRPTIVAVMPETVPVNVGLARFALRSSAVCCAVETGLLASLVLSTLPRPTIVAEIPATVPVNVGEARFAFKSKAVCVAVETGLLVSEVLLTFPKPTIVAEIPATVPVNVGEARFAFRSRAV